MIGLKSLIVSALLFIVIAYSDVAVSQTPDAAAKFRLAQRFEQSGDFESAARQYESLHAADPANVVYFEGLRRTYLQLKRYEDLIALLRKRLGLFPGDVGIRGALGSAYYQSGLEKEAHAEWERAIAVDPANPTVYRIIASILLENRLLDKTADLYRRARIACNDPSVFTLDLAQVLAVSMDYVGATTEYVRWIRQNPVQLGFVQGRMANFTGKQEAREAALKVLRDEVRQSNEVFLHKLIGWMLLEGKQFNEAFDVYRTIDRMSKAQGLEIFSFAERVFKEGSYETAIKAYLEAIKTPVAPAMMPHAKYGYALALKERGMTSDTLQQLPFRAEMPGGPVAENQARFRSAVDYFREVIAEYPHTEFSARSYYQIGLIQHEQYFDLDGALRSFEAVERELPGVNPLRSDVTIRIGEVFVAKGNLERAVERFQMVLNTPTATPDQQDKATYRLAEITYFSGDFQGAMELLESISQNLRADYANDALSLHAFLQENSATADLALRELARADFLTQQRKNSEAIAILQQVVEQFPQALLIDDALIRMARLQARSGLLNDAIGTYRRLLTEFKEKSIALDHAQFHIAQLYDYGLGQRDNAIAEYTRLLSDFPESILASQARKRVRELRGDSL